MKELTGMKEGIRNILKMIVVLALLCGVAAGLAIPPDAELEPAYRVK